MNLINQQLQQHLMTLQTQRAGKTTVNLKDMTVSGDCGIGTKNQALTSALENVKPVENEKIGQNLAGVTFNSALDDVLLECYKTGMISEGELDDCSIMPETEQDKKKASKEEALNELILSLGNLTPTSINVLKQIVMDQESYIRPQVKFYNDNGDQLLIKRNGAEVDLEEELSPISESYANPNTVYPNAALLVLTNVEVQYVGSKSHLAGTVIITPKTINPTFTGVKTAELFVIPNKATEESYFIVPTKITARS